MIRNLLVSRKNWGEVAFLTNEKTVSYGELAQKSFAIQSVLPQTGRENIAILLPNSSDYIAAFYGTIRSGMVAFPLSVAMTKYELIPLLLQASVRIILTSNCFRSLFEGKGNFRFNVIYIEELPNRDFSEELSNLKFCEEPSNSDFCEDEDSAMLLLATSGTTGNSKIVKLTQRNVETAVKGYLEKINFERTDMRFILATPFCSAYGIMVLSACLQKSLPIIPVEDHFTLDGFYKTAEKHKATHYEGGASVLLLMEQMAGRPIPYDISRLRYFGFGGSKVSGKVIRNLKKLYPGIELFQGYGMTEAAPLIAKFHWNMPIRPESVGTAINDVDIAVEVDGQIVHTPYKKGEIVVKGANVMQGYYEDERATARVLKNGYLFTGDMGYLDQEGYLYLRGRKKNIIIIRGLNVHPEEVEECILNSELVKDCLVYGNIDAFGNEMVCADVVPLHSHIKEEAIRAYCKTHLAGYKQPQVMALCKELTKTASGKIERVRKEEKQWT